MGKRKERSEISETLIRRGGGEEDEIMEGEKEGFFACYLLTSLSPRFKGHSYIGFTVNPRRRIRQHNGEIRCGAFRTKNRRPWEMVLCIYGFPTNIAALQFEWAWQHPIESLAVRKAAAAFKSLSGIANKIKLAYTMLTLPAWQSFNLTVNFFSTKYTKHSAGCPSLPEHMKVQVRSMDELPCYTGGDWNVVENGEWDETEEFDGTGEASGLIIEGLEEATVHNSDDFQNGECDETGKAYRLVNEKLADATVHVSAHDDHHNSIEETTSEWITSIEGNGTRQPFCLNNSPERTLLSSFATNSNKEILEDRVIFRLIEECNVELDRPTTTAAHKSRPTNKSFSSIPCEVEVIDVFTPSPGNRIRSRREKRGVSTVCPEIIDLTKSPIFV